MQSNPTPPVPRDKIWCAVYADADTECFEIRSLLDEDKHPATLFHKEYTFGTAIGDFLETDLSIWDQLQPKIQEAVQSINTGRYLKKSFNTIFYCTLYWLDQSAFFAPFAASLQRLQIVHSVGDLISLDECNDQMEYYRDLQGYLRDLVGRVFAISERRTRRCATSRSNTSSARSPIPRSSSSPCATARRTRTSMGFTPMTSSWRRSRAATRRSL